MTTTSAASMRSARPSSSATSSKPLTRSPPTAASPPASPPAAPPPTSGAHVDAEVLAVDVDQPLEAAGEQRDLRRRRPLLRWRRRGRRRRSAVRTSQAAISSTPRSRPTPQMARTAPRPPSVVAEPPMPTMIRSAPASSAAAISSPVPWRGRGHRDRSPPPRPTRARPDASAISITAVPLAHPPRRIDRITERAHHHRRAGRSAERGERALAPVGHRRLVALAPERGDGPRRPLPRPRPPTPCLGTCRWLRGRAPPEPTARPSLYDAGSPCGRPRASTDGGPCDADHDLSTMDATAQAELVRTARCRRPSWSTRPSTRIEKVNPEINAVIHERFEAARAEAARHAARRSVPRRAVPAQGPRRDDGRRPVPRGQPVPEEASTTGPPTTPASPAGSSPPGWSSSVARTRRSSVRRSPPSRWPTARAATRGTPSTRPAGRPVARPPRWPPAWSRWPTPTTAADRSACRRASAGWSGLKPSRGRRHATIPRARGGWARPSTASSAERCATPRRMLDCIAGYEPGDPYTAPAPARPFAEEVGADPGRLRGRRPRPPAAARRRRPSRVRRGRGAAAAPAGVARPPRRGGPSRGAGGSGLHARTSSPSSPAATAAEIGDVGAGARPAGRAGRHRGRQPRLPGHRRQLRRAGLRGRRRAGSTAGPGGRSRGGRRTASTCSSRRPWPSPRPRSATCPIPSSAGSAWPRCCSTRRSSTSPASPRSACRCTGRRTGCRSACSWSRPYGREDLLLRVAAQLEEAQPWARPAARACTPDLGPGLTRRRAV